MKAIDKFVAMQSDKGVELVAIDEQGAAITSREPEAARLDLVAEIPYESFARLMRFAGPVSKIEKTCDEYGPIVRAFVERKAA